MIEQLIENWLTKATEKSFQIPFCFMLANEGYTVLHLTRHCGMELGKDVIAIDPQGIPCAYQLKGTNGSKIKLSYWREQLLSQTYQLTHNRLMHPSIPVNAPHHKSYFVTNGELEEEVSSSIANDNHLNEINGHPELKLNVLVKGQLVDKAKKLGLNFIPPDFADFKLLLEFYLEDGKGTIDKSKFSHLLEVIFDRPVKESEHGNLIRGSALISSLATSGYSNAENHIALIEAWTIYISYLFNYVDSHLLPEKLWKNEFNIAEQIIVTSLENLFNECEDLPHFLTNTYLEDGFVHNARTTWILGFVSSLGIYRKFKVTNESDINRIYTFTKKHQPSLELYGESAVPNYLAFYWFQLLNDATQTPTVLLSQLINTILSNIRKPDIIYPEPYYDIDESLSLRWEKDTKIVKEKNQKGMSYFLEGLFHLFVREGYRQRVALLWPDVSKTFFRSFRFDKSNDFYRWRNVKGKEVMTTPQPTKSWAELKNEALEHNGLEIPELMKKHLFLYPLFLIVFPFRASPSGIRWFDSAIIELARS